MRRSPMAAWILAILACWSLAGPALALEEQVDAQGVPFVTGGVGLDEREALNQMSGRYNLRLEFAQQNRDYLGAVTVTLKGPVTFEAVSDGPWLLVKLPPGSYRLNAVADGVGKTGTVSVPATGFRVQVLHW